MFTKYYNVLKLSWYIFTLCYSTGLICWLVMTLTGDEMNNVETMSNIYLCLYKTGDIYEYTKYIVTNPEILCIIALMRIYLIKVNEGKTEAANEQNSNHCTPISIHVYLCKIHSRSTWAAGQFVFCSYCRHIYHVTSSGGLLFSCKWWVFPLGVHPESIQTVLSLSSFHSSHTQTPKSQTAQSACHWSLLGQMKPFSSQLVATVHYTSACNQNFCPSITSALMFCRALLNSKF